MNTNIDDNGRIRIKLLDESCELSLQQTEEDRRGFWVWKLAQTYQNPFILSHHVTFKICPGTHPVSQISASTRAKMTHESGFRNQSGLMMAWLGLRLTLTRSKQFHLCPMLDDGSFMWTFNNLRVYAFFSFIANQTPDARECKPPPPPQSPPGERQE